MPTLQLACTSDNFRVISLSSIVAKVFDVIILSKEQYALTTSHLQLGFKQHMSTTHCTYVMMETISHYNADGTDVYALMFDASKAIYGKPFIVLLKRQVSLLVLRFLLYMYTKQKLQVKWDCSISSQFTACNGVREQSSLLFFFLYIWMDYLNS